MSQVLSDWPTPPYFSFDAGKSAAGPESCLLYMLDAKKALGDLISLAADGSSIVFLSSRSDVNELIPLNKIKTIRLLKPVAMHRQMALLHERADEVYHSADRQTFAVEFVDKEAMDGETIGYAETGWGLFLYLPQDDEHVVRSLIPKHAMARFQIGMHLGEMLVKENLVKKNHVEEAVAQQKNRKKPLGQILVDMGAVNDGVSDIHIETNSGKKNTRVRFRKDGVLADYIEIPANFLRRWFHASRSWRRWISPTAERRRMARLTSSVLGQPKLSCASRPSLQLTILKMSSCVCWLQPSRCR